MTHSSVMRDVVVIGAGPAGLTTAASLAAAGHDVVVLEEHSEVGRPVHCTGVLGHEAFDELDLPRQSILAVTGAASFRYGHGEPVCVETERIKAVIVDRPSFDGALAVRARDRGAELQTSARAARIIRLIKVATAIITRAKRIGGNLADKTLLAPRHRAIVYEPRKTAIRHLAYGQYLQAGR